MHAYTCPLLWWWYDNDTVYSILRVLHKSLILSEMNLLPATDIILLGNPYYAKHDLEC